MNRFLRVDYLFILFYFVLYYKALAVEITPQIDSVISLVGL